MLVKAALIPWLGTAEGAYAWMTCAISLAKAPRYRRKLEVNEALYSNSITSSFCYFLSAHAASTVATALTQAQVKSICAKKGSLEYEG